MNGSHISIIQSPDVFHIEKLLEKNEDEDYFSDILIDRKNPTICIGEHIQMNTDLCYPTCQDNPKTFTN